MASPEKKTKKLAKGGLVEDEGEKETVKNEAKEDEDGDDGEGAGIL